jgi:hypothetical protein
MSRRSKVGASTDSPREDLFCVTGGELLVCVVLLDVDVLARRRCTCRDTDHDGRGGDSGGDSG